MAKILLIVAIAISLITAGLGFVNRQNLAKVQEELETSQTNLTSARKQVTDTKTELAAAKDSIDAANKEKEAASSELVTAQSEASTAKKAAEDAQASIEQQKEEIASLNDEIKRLSDAQASPEGTPVVESGPSPREAELEAMVEQLNQKLAAQEGEVVALREKEEARTKQVMRQGLEGRVLAVNPAWNFVVLSIGDRSGVVNNAELLLRRGGQYLGKVRVTSVEPSTSIADIVANTLPAGVSVQPGDSVIYQASEN